MLLIDQNFVVCAHSLIGMMRFPKKFHNSNSSPPAIQFNSFLAESAWILLNLISRQNVQLMKMLDVSLICDLMVEKKKLKYGVL